MLSSKPSSRTIGHMNFSAAADVSPRLEVRESTGSTNADLRSLVEADAGMPHLAVVLTSDQRAGRGRLDRTWETPPGSALAISVLLRVGEVAVSERGWIPLLAGLAMAEAVAEQLPGENVALKWPNDVLVGGGKICGILAEAMPGDAVIVGAGVNTAMDAAQAPVPTATSFAMHGVSSDDDRLVASYLRRLASLVAALRGTDAVSAGIHTQVSSRCVTIGKDVRVVMPAGDMIGRATALAPDGRLVVATANGEQIVGAGDVVHLRAHSG